jgi:chromosome segregation ATPase
VIFLIAKIFMYMLLSLAAGAAAGWLWRHQQAAQQEGSLERSLMDARSRLPQMETALRSRDERLNTMARDIQEYRSALTEHEATVADRDRAVADLERTCAELRQRLEQAAGKPAGPADAEDGDEIALHPGDPSAQDAGAVAVAAPAQPETAAATTLDAGERQALETALDEARGALAEARSALAEARAEADQARAEAEQACAEAEQARQATAGQGHDALEASQAALAAEQRKVAELTRERDLQHQALRALEQRLELAEERRAANG